MIKGFGMPKIGSRDDYLIATSSVGSGSSSYDEDGRLITSAARTTVEFYGDVKDVKSNPYLNPIDPLTSNTRQIEITADSRDVESLDNTYTLRITGRPQVFQVIDVYEHEYRFTSMVVAQQVD